MWQVETGTRGVPAAHGRRPAARHVAAESRWGERAGLAGRPASTGSWSDDAVSAARSTCTWSRRRGPAAPPELLYQPCAWIGRRGAVTIVVPDSPEHLARLDYPGCPRRRGRRLHGQAAAHPRAAGRRARLPGRGRLAAENAWDFYSRRPRLPERPLRGLAGRDVVCTRSRLPGPAPVPPPPEPTARGELDRRQPGHVGRRPGTRWRGTCWRRPGTGRGLRQLPPRTRTSRRPGARSGS